MKLKKNLGMLMGITGGLANAMLKIDGGDFVKSEKIPLTYVHAQCGGQNLFPTLSWTTTAQGIKSFTIIIDDPNAPTKEPWVHFVMFNIPANILSINEKNIKTLKDAKIGTNSWGLAQWGGPCPPKGSGVHNYQIYVYALDTLLDVTSKATKKDVLDAIKGHILAQDMVLGRYEQK